MAVKTWTSSSSTSFSTASNWSDNAAPVNSDTLIFDGTGTANVATDLSSGLTGLTIIIEPQNSSQIGTDTTPLTISGGTLKMPRTQGSGSPAGTSLVNIAFGSAAATVIIETSNSTGYNNRPTVRLTGLNITAKISGGNVGFAVGRSTTATIADILVCRGTGSAPLVFLGDGVTMTAGTFEAGTAIDRSSNTRTTIRVSGATYYVEATSSGAITTMHIDAGTVYDNGSGTTTNLNIRGTYNGDANPNGKTVTTAKVYKGATLSFDNGKPGSFVFTNAVEFADGFVGGNDASITVRGPAGLKATIATI